MIWYIVLVGSCTFKGESKRYPNQQLGLFRYLRQRDVLSFVDVFHYMAFMKEIKFTWRDVNLQQHLNFFDITRTSQISILLMTSKDKDYTSFRFSKYYAVI